MLDEGISIKNNESINTHVIFRDCPYPHPPHNIPHVFHYHPYMELQYVLEGNINTNINNVTYPGHPNDLIIINSHEPHYTSIPEHARFIVIKTLPDVLGSTFQTTNEHEYAFHLQNSCTTDNRIIHNATELRSLFTEAYDKFKSNEFASELYIRSNVMKIFAFILHYWENNNLITTVKSKTAMENIYIINELMNKLKTKKDFSVKTHDAALACNMSDGYFSRIFRQITNQTFTEYVKLLKISEADRLLKCTDDSITDISYALNYSSTSHFIEDFKKNFGVSPQKYRKYLTGEDNLQ